MHLDCYLQIYLPCVLWQLKKIYEDVKQRVSKKMKSTHQVSSWLKKILKLEKDVSRTLKDGEEQDQNKCLGDFCPKNCLSRSNYKLRAIVRKKLEEVKKLKTGGQFNAVVQKGHDPVKKIPVGVTVGLDFTLQKVRICIEDKTLGIIGLYGIGVVGKTPFSSNQTMSSSTLDMILVM